MLPCGTNVHGAHPPMMVKSLKVSSWKALLTVGLTPRPAPGFCRWHQHDMSPCALGNVPSILKPCNIKQGLNAAQPTGEKGALFMRRVVLPLWTTSLHSSRVQGTSLRAWRSYTSDAPGCGVKGEWHGGWRFRVQGRVGACGIIHSLPSHPQRITHTHPASYIDGCPQLALDAWPDGR